MSNIQEEIAKEREQARTADPTGRNLDNVAARDAVEELDAEASHQPKPKSSFEQYCDDNPGSSECRVYEE